MYDSKKKSNMPRQAGGTANKSVVRYVTLEAGKRRRHHSIAVGDMPEGNNTASSRRKILSVIPQTATDLQATLTSEIVTRPSMPLANIRIGNHVRPRNYGLIPARLLVECLEPTELVAALRILGTELPSSGAICWLRSHEAWNAA